MINYYCKNCNKLVGEWFDYDIRYDCFSSLFYCCNSKSKNSEFIYFLDCENCKKFVGILCCNVCENCFGKNEIFGEKNIFNWFLKYKKIMSEYLNSCKVCNEKNFKLQYWFFEELTFQKYIY